jgi:lysophospholipase L1-like esterase
LEQRLLPLARAARGAGIVKILAACAFVSACAPAAARPPEPALVPASGQLESREPEATGAPTANAEPSATDPETAVTPANAPATPSSELPRGTLVLHVGDSFAGSLGVPLSKRLKAAGLRSVLEYQTASYIPTWASSPELTQYVSRYSPDLVLVTLGANEFELSAPDTRANAVRRLVRKLEGRPCVWVTPPRWKPDTGILKVIHENLKPCRFLDSDTIVQDLSRKKDGIHPSDDAREIWAEAVLAWLARERQSGAERPWQLREE